MTKRAKYIRCSICEWPMLEDEAEYACNCFERPLCHACSIAEMERQFDESEGPQP